MLEITMTKLGVLLGGLVTAIVLLFSGGPGSDFSQAESTNRDKFREQLIHYADSVNRILPRSEKQISLQYSFGNYSFQIVKYTHHGKPLLYIEKGAGGATGKIEKRYYLRDNHLALYTEKSQPGNQSGPYISTNAYFRNNKLVHAEQRSALTDSGLNAACFRKTDLPKKDQFSDLAVLDDAIRETGQFSLVFKGIAEYPKAKYIILGKEGFNSLRAPIRVREDDEFVHELSTNIDEYRGEKLDISWGLSTQNEVVYQSGKLSKN